MFLIKKRLYFMAYLEPVYQSLQQNSRPPAYHDIICAKSYVGQMRGAAISDLSKKMGSSLRSLHCGHKGQEAAVMVAVFTLGLFLVMFAINCVASLCAGHIDKFALICGVAGAPCGGFFIIALIIYIISTIIYLRETLTSETAQTLVDRAHQENTQAIEDLEVAQRKLETTSQHNQIELARRKELFPKIEATKVKKRTNSSHRSERCD